MSIPCPITSIKNAPVQIDGNVLVDEVGHSIVSRSYISELKNREFKIKEE
jgi:hypothetical protein